MTAYKNNVYHNFKDNQATKMLDSSSSAFSYDPVDGRFSASDQIEALEKDIDIINSSIYRRTEIELEPTQYVDLKNFACYVKNNQIHFMGYLTIINNVASGTKILDTKNLLYTVPGKLDTLAAFPVFGTNYTQKNSICIIQNDGFYIKHESVSVTSERPYIFVNSTFPLLMPYNI